MFFQNQWGSVCLGSNPKSYLSKLSSDTICNYFGFVGSVADSDFATDFGTTEGPVWVDPGFEPMVDSFTCPLIAVRSLDIISCVQVWGNRSLEESTESTCASHKNDVAVVCNSTYCFILLFCYLFYIFTSLCFSLLWLNVILPIK